MWNKLKDIIGDAKDAAVILKERAVEELAEAKEKASGAKEFLADKYDDVKEVVADKIDDVKVATQAVKAKRTTKETVSGKE